MPHPVVVLKQLGVLAALVLLAGCSGTSQPAATVTVTAPAPAPTTAGTPTPTPSDSALSKGRTFRTAQATTTVLAYSKSVRVGDGTHIQTLLVKTCVTSLRDDPEGLSLSWSPWSLVDPDSSRHEPAEDRWDHVGASYPDGDDYFKVGECAKGVIQFDPSKTKAQYARYSNEDGDTAIWKL